MFKNRFATKLISCVAVAALLCVCRAGALTVKEITFGNAKAELAFKLDNMRVGGAVLTNKLAGEKAVLSGEGFEILLMNGSTIKQDDMRAEAREAKTAADGTKSLEITFASKQLKAEVIYSVKPNSAVMKKQIRVCAAGPEKVEVDRVSVSVLRGLKGARHGGFGQPVFYNDFFFGLESPAGYNLVEGDDVVLRHYPGWTLAPGECRTSYDAVIGMADKGQVEEAFRDYVDSFRYSWKSMLLYNSWYDVQIGMNISKFKSVMKKFDKGLGKYGVKLDYLVVDDGWQNRDSIWETSKQSFPKDFGPLRKVFEEGGSKFGLWLPLCGYKLNARWGADNGYEADRNMQYYCLAGPKYNAALRTRLNNLVLEQGTEYFKHDFNYFECYNPATPYPQTKRHSFEANIDAEAGLLDYIHSLNSESYLNVTSNMWLSPWWLSHSDTLWIGSSDYGYDYGGASLEPRDWAITYVDGWMHRRLVEEGARYPTNAIMTHGIIDGVLNRLGGENEEFKTWADNVIMYMGRGVYMRELYLSPELLNDRQWRFLAEAAKWAKASDGAFRRTDLIGGDPKKGEAYGYHHRGAGQELFAVRNPGMDPQTLKLPKIRAGLRLQQVYPVYKYLNDNSGIELGGHVTAILRGVPEREIQRPAPIGVDYDIVEAGPGKTIYNIYSSVAPALIGAKPKSVKFEKSAAETASIAPSSGGKLCAIENRAYVCRAKMTVPAAKSYFHVALYSTKNPYLLSWLEIDGKRFDNTNVVNSKTDNKPLGQGWRLFRMDVAPGSREVTVRIPAEAVMEAPFAARDYRLAMYLESEEGIPASRLVIEHGNVADSKEASAPPLREPGKDRAIETMPMSEQAQLDFNLSEFGLKGALTAEELKTAKCAKIRMKIFGVRGGDTMKTILINRAPSGSVPSNDFPFEFWQEVLADLPTVKTLKMTNTFEISNTLGGEFKFKDVALAVQLADGTWRETGVVSEVQSSGKEWKYAEGTVFGMRSKAIKLEFK
ncbi:MAG: hypothetical protein WCX65_06560 [bacterium]